MVNKHFYELHTARGTLEQNVSCYICNLVSKLLKVKLVNWTFCNSLTYGLGDFISHFLLYGFSILESLRQNQA